MATNISLQLYYPTYVYARELPTHLARARAKPVFTGTRIEVPNLLRNGRTLGQFLEMFFLNAHIDHKAYPKHFPGAYSQYHSPTLRPDTFHDNRDPYLQDYENFPPGKPPFSYAATEWPAWTTHTGTPQTYKYHFTYPEQVLDAAYAIALYWHIPSLAGRRHKSKGSALASILDSLSCGYLIHPLLPPPHQ